MLRGVVKPIDLMSSVCINELMLNSVPLYDSTDTFDNITYRRYWCHYAYNSDNHSLNPALKFGYFSLI